jgi:hypothetical protein
MLRRRWTQVFIILALRFLNASKIITGKLDVAGLEEMSKDEKRLLPNYKLKFYFDEKYHTLEWVPYEVTNQHFYSAAEEVLGCELCEITVLILDCRRISPPEWNRYLICAMPPRTVILGRYALLQPQIPGN